MEMESHTDVFGWLGSGFIEREGLFGAKESYYESINCDKSGISLSNALLVGDLLRLSVQNCERNTNAETWQTNVLGVSALTIRRYGD